MKKHIRLARSIVGWFIVICGAGIIASMFPDIYFYVFQGSLPGTPIYADHVAMAKSQMARYVIYGVIIMLAGYIITPERKYEYSDDELADMESMKDGVSK